MVALAILIFLVARFDLRASVSQGVIGLTLDATRAEVAFMLLLAFLFVFWNFQVRTRAERSDMSAYAARLRRTIQHIDGTRNRTAGLFRRFEGAMLSERLGAWDEALRKVTVLPAQADLRQIEKIRVKLERFELISERVQQVLANVASPREEADQAAHQESAARWREEAQEIVHLLDTMVEMGKSFEERREQLSTALTVTGDVMSDARSFFSDEAGRGAEDLNAKLAAAVDEIRQIGRHLSSEERSWRRDRSLFGVQLPGLISILLVLASIDAVATGFVDVLQRVQRILG